MRHKEISEKEIDMQTRSSIALAAFATAALAGLASADISTVNGIRVVERNFNDFPTSTLTTTNNGLAGLRFEEQFPAGIQGNFANRHFGYFSNDGGASNYQFGGNPSFEISMNIRINAGFAQNVGGTRKEAGLYFFNKVNDSGWIDEGRFGVFADGEVAIFGALQPFTGFGNAYTINTTATMIYRYWAAGIMDPTRAAMQAIFIDAVKGQFDSGIKLYDNDPVASGGLRVGSEIALLAQNSRLPTINDFSDIEYSNITVIPTPGALAALGMAGVFASRRRR